MTDDIKNVIASFDTIIKRQNRIITELSRNQKNQDKIINGLKKDVNDLKAELKTLKSKVVLKR
jgi:seryl-tRNA synthetase